MWSGLTAAHEHKSFKSTEQKMNKLSDGDLSKKLQGEQAVNKKRLSKFLWYHCEIRSRNEAETKLKACGKLANFALLILFNICYSS